jgi:hypothetical protein
MAAAEKAVQGEGCTERTNGESIVVSEGLIASSVAMTLVAAHSNPASGMKARSGVRMELSYEMSR